MTGLEALQNVQYVTVRGKRFAVVDADDWEALLEWLETVEDIDTVQQAYAQLKEADGDRSTAGWLNWEDVRQELE